MERMQRHINPNIHYTIHIPLHPTQARFLCGPSDYFWDIVGVCISQHNSEQKKMQPPFGQSIFCA